MAWLYSIGIILVTSICLNTSFGINARHILKRAVISPETPLIRNPADESTENTAVSRDGNLGDDNPAVDIQVIQLSSDKNAEAETVSKLNSGESNHKTPEYRDDDYKDGYLKNDDYTDSSDSAFDFSNYYSILNGMLETDNQGSNGNEFSSLYWLDSNSEDVQQDDDTATYSRGKTDINEGRKQDNSVPPVFSLLNSAKIRDPQQIIFQNSTPARGISSSKLVLYIIFALVIAVTVFKIASTRNRWGNVKVIKITEVDHDDNKWSEYSGHGLDERAKELEAMLMDDDTKQED